MGKDSSHKVCGCISRNIFILRFSSSYQVAGNVRLLDAVLDVQLSSDSHTFNFFNEAFVNGTFRHPHRCLLNAAMPCAMLPV